jgi:hypothetical protein
MRTKWTHPLFDKEDDMQDLMEFEVVSELLGLDARDEKRNRLFLSAVSEEVSLFLDRNLLTGTLTERQETNLGEFDPEQYPVREFTEIVDDRTGTHLDLAAESSIRAISRPDAHTNRSYRIQGERDRMIRYTYRYGYELAEVPALIQACILDLMRDRLEGFGSKTEEDEKKADRLKNINVYRRLYL